VSDKLLTAEDVADMLGMRIDVVYALGRRDQIPHVPAGRSVRFPDEAISRWLEETERGNGHR
jgi:excisionase family DNA binding protein